jgi:uncharacterized protein (DUF4415 family)
MTARKRSTGSSSARADRDNPEWTERDFARAVPHVGGTRVSMSEFRKAAAKAMGRPRSDNPKKSVSLRLDRDVVAHYRDSGPGWQTRINETLRRAARLPKQVKRA